MTPASFSARVRDVDLSQEDRLDWGEAPAASRGRFAKVASRWAVPGAIAMLRHWVLSIVVVSCVGGAPALARTWTSASGTFSVDADLVESRADGTLLLKRTDGQ